MADAKNIEIKLKNVRGSFLNIFTPQPGKNEAGDITRYNFNGSFLIPKDDEEQINLIKDAIKKAKKAAWGDNPPRLGSDKLCLRDGEPADEDGHRAPLYDGYAGCFYVSANKPVKPEEYEKIKRGDARRPVSIIGPKKGADGKFKELSEGDEFAPYSGCYLNVVLRIYGYKGDPANNQPPRINASLEAVQFKRHGEAFGASRVDVNSAFDEEEDDDMVGGSAAKSSAMDDEDDDLDIG